MLEKLKNNNLTSSDRIAQKCTKLLYTQINMNLFAMQQKPLNGMPLSESCDVRNIFSPQLESIVSSAAVSAATLN